MGEDDAVIRMEGSTEFWVSYLHSAAGMSNVTLVPGDGGHKDTHAVLLAAASPLVCNLLLEVGEQQGHTIILLPDFNLEEVEEWFDTWLLGHQEVSSGSLSATLGLLAPKKQELRSKKVPVKVTSKGVKQEVTSRRIVKRKQEVDFEEWDRVDEVHSRAVASYLQGEESLRSAATRFGVKNSTLSDWVKSARQGRARTAKSGRMSVVFTREEEDALRNFVLQSEPGLTVMDLQRTMQDFLIRAKNADPGRKTGYEETNHKPPKCFVYRFAYRLGISKALKHESSQTRKVRKVY